MKEELKKKFYEDFGIECEDGGYYGDIEVGTKIREILDWIDENFVPIETLVRQGVPQPVQTTGSLQPIYEYNRFVIPIKSLKAIKCEGDKKIILVFNAYVDGIEYLDEKERDQNFNLLNDIMTGCLSA